MTLSAPENTKNVLFICWHTHSAQHSVPLLDGLDGTSSLDGHDGGRDAEESVSRNGGPGG